MPTPRVPVAALITVLSTGCGPGTQSVPATNTAGGAQTAHVVATQIAVTDPCGWISKDQAERALSGPLLHPPERVWSVDNHQISDTGEACLFELPAADGGRAGIAIHLIPDESGALQSAFAGMGNVEAEFASSTAAATASSDARWDFSATMLGGVTALRRGRVAVQMTTSPALTERGLKLAGAILDRIQDLPFTLHAEDPAVRSDHLNPCLLINRQEAEASLGPLLVAPYRSRKATALAFGNGPSCAYFSGLHRALVVTPRWKRGREFFAMLGGATVHVDRQFHSPSAPTAAESNWDQLTLGADGSLEALKGDAMVSVQFITSPADREVAERLVAIALERLPTIAMQR